MRNTIGQIFRVTTFGESHGIALGCVIDGCPPRIPLSEKDIQAELDRRKPGQSNLTTPRAEKDKVKILSGVFQGKTLGTPIAMVIFNADAKSADYENLKNVFRAGHADETWQAKFGFRDYRGGGRASGRETVARVMAGAVAQKILAMEKIKIFAYAVQIGAIKGEKVDLNFIEKNPVRAADKIAYKKMEKEILAARADGDSVGGIIEIIVKNAPAGLGEPVFDKLTADFAKALCGVPAVKGIEFGSGFSAAAKKGSEQNDPKKNHSGGILGGISNGQDIIMRIAVKPPSSIKKFGVSGRHDPCIVPRAIPVAEAMTAIVLTDHLLRNKTARL
ncbi:chorismate synthase [Candidatus Peregrinibacteria bacterium]|nr:chorismate synthase [Candidatus Peregrinibacteria bacterium]